MTTGFGSTTKPCLGALLALPLLLQVCACSPQDAASQDAQAAPAAGQQAPPPEAANDKETQLGLAAYEELRDKGEIVQSSPLYGPLNAVAGPIAKAAQPRYPHPFRFVLVHEMQPNAFAVPGGYVFVTDSLLYFVKNREELSGTLCHEVSHTIHRDAMSRMAEQQRIEKRELAAAILFKPSLAQLLAINMVGDLHSLSYSRDIESSADVTGSDICAGAGSNPWGLVWLFQDFQNADPHGVPQLLSDHPANTTRITTLKAHFRDNPGVFSTFDTDPKSATPFSVPPHAPEEFLPPGPKAEAETNPGAARTPASSYPMALAQPRSAGLRILIQ
jgi:predicted Zn-dependent protease